MDPSKKDRRLGVGGPIICWHRRFQGERDGSHVVWCRKRRCLKVVAVKAEDTDDDKKDEVIPYSSHRSSSKCQCPYLLFGTRNIDKGVIADGANLVLTLPARVEFGPGRCRAQGISEPSPAGTHPNTNDSHCVVNDERRFVCDNACRK
jgi:hypothetical protein